jgi:hypothetical protein
MTTDTRVCLSNLMQIGPNAAFWRHVITSRYEYHS